MINKLIDGYCRVTGYLIAAMLAVMVVLVFGNVVMRYGFNSGFTISEELSRWLFVWMTFLGAVIAMHERAHLGTDMLVARLPRWGKKACLGLGYLAMLGVCWLLFKGALDQTRINLTTSSAIMEVSMGWFYASGMAFAVSAAIILLMDFWRLLSGQLGDDQLVGIRESEETTAEGEAK